MGLIKSVRRLSMLLLVSHYAHVLEIEFISMKVKTLALIISMLLLLSGCFLKQDRTTTVYGTITDQNGQPVDSILVLVSGLYHFYQENTLKEIYSDSSGNYEVLLEVPKKYNALDVIIPFLPKTNAKFQNNYKGYDIKKNDQKMNNCCTASIGDKTKYDFQLNPR